MNNKSIVWLKDISKKGIRLVGGKAANLGELYSKFPIPNGFCITVKAFDNFLQDNKIKDRIISIVKNMEISNLDKADKVSKEINHLIMNSNLSKEIETEVIKNYKKINGYVAVRSSAVAEDLEQASFAGQQATFLNVKGNKDLLAKIKACWASYYSSRAIVYREKNNFGHEPLMAVAVQQMIDSKKSGVAFTINPVNSNKNELVIEAVFGLGESIVSGMVTPDYFLIDKKNHKILQKVINEKKIAIIKKNGRNIKLNLNVKKANERTLSDKELKELIKEILKIENHYKKPMDIEWAIDDRLYILQARPVTTA